MRQEEVTIILSGNDVVPLMENGETAPWKKEEEEDETYRDDDEEEDDESEFESERKSTICTSNVNVLDFTLARELHSDVSSRIVLLGSHSVLACPMMRIRKC